MPTPPSPLLTFSSDDVPERERLAFVREVYGRTIIKLDLEPLPEVPLSLTAKFVSLPDLGLAVGSFTPLRGTLTSQLVDSNDIILNITLSGGRIVEQRGRRVSIGPGEAVATTSTDPGVVTVHSASDFISLRVARKTLQPMVGNLDACLARTISARNDALGLLTGYAGLINEFDALAKPDIARLVATHFHDLISITLGATRDAAETARGRGVRAARLRGVKEYVLQNIARSDLTIGAAATAHGITPRYLRMLFASEQTSFTDFVLNCRLDRAHRMLRDPRYAATSISDIAFACGFGDLSYFNRAFRRRYGATPSEVREAAVWPVGSS